MNKLAKLAKDDISFDLTHFNADEETTDEIFALPLLWSASIAIMGFLSKEKFRQTVAILSK